MSRRSNNYSEKNIEHYREISREQKRRYRNKYKNASNSNKRYTPEEDRLILSHKICDSELAKKIGRSVGSIQLRRHRLKHVGVDYK